VYAVEKNPNAIITLQRILVRLSIQVFLFKPSLEAATPLSAMAWFV
jgi:hypothetical protein